jgi:hypothetical protein
MSTEPENTTEATAAAPEATPENANNGQRRSRTATVAHYLLIASIVAIVLSPLGFRTGLLDLMIALPLMPLGAVLALLAVIVGTAGIMTTRCAAGRGRALTALVGGGIIVVIVGVMVGGPMTAGYPAIHDITTDTENAPAFIALKAARDAAPNGTDYPGGDVTEQQKAAYPDLDTFVTPHPGTAVFAAAEAAAVSMGWDMIDLAPNEGRIEATATTRIYGYKDDIVIRIQPTMSGTTEVDVRSVSRVGQGDLGANAARIRAFITALQQQLADNS